MHEAGIPTDNIALDFQQCVGRNYGNELLARLQLETNRYPRL
jgi:hypothetical protein